MTLFSHHWYFAWGEIFLIGEGGCLFIGKWLGKMSLVGLVLLFLFSSSLTSEEKPYQTPLSGQAYTGQVFGKKINLPSRDKSITTAWTTLVFLTVPKVGSYNPLPLGAFYYRYLKEKTRLRVLASGAANQILGGVALGPSWEALALFENFTPPLALGETLDRREIEDGEIFYGYTHLSLGGGWKKKISPYLGENFLSLAVFYQMGFSYFERTSTTSPLFITPPKTYEHGIYARFRANGFTRNILEMRHLGWSAGADLVWKTREKWRAHGMGGEEKKKATRSYFTLKAFGLTALPIPFLSSRHRLLFSVYGGYSPDQLDRYSALPLGGGSSADEAEALARPILWGAQFQEFSTRQYLVATAEYRYEIFFFLYGHLRISGGRMTFRSLPRGYSRTSLGAFSCGLTSGFFWTSVLVLDYGYNWELKKGRRRGGHLFVLRWSISF